MWHPWRELRALTDTVMATEQLPSGDGWWSPAYDVILLRPGLLQVERRCVLAHELGHRALDHTGVCDYPDASRQDNRAEAHADQWAARRLIEIRPLLAAMQWSDDDDEVADELWVTPRLLAVRLEYLHVGEAHFLRRHLEEKQDPNEETA